MLRTCPGRGVTSGGTISSPVAITATRGRRCTSTRLTPARDAAGNEASNNDAGGTPTYPCNFSHANILCIAALDQSFTLASFSNWGATSVDVGAPGATILSTFAGTTTAIPDNFNTGGTLNWTTIGGGWAYRPPIPGSPFDALVNPAGFPSGTYGNNANNRVYRAFDLSGKNAATLRFSAQFTVQPGDSFNINYRSNGGDPFEGGVQLAGGDVRAVYYAALAVYALWGCVALNLARPLTLVIIGANAAGVILVVISLHTVVVNRTLLPPALRPPKWREAALVGCALFYGAAAAVMLVATL